MLELLNASSSIGKCGPLFGGRTIGICKPEGNYTVLYGQHDRKGNPKHLPDQFDGLFLECSGFNYPEDPLGTLQSFREPIGNGNRTYRQYVDVIKFAEDRRIPIFFADPRLTDLNEILKDSALQTVEMFTGAGLAGHALINYFLRHRFSRREAIKLMGAGWLLAPRIALMSRVIAVLSDTNMEFSGEFLKNAYRLHPELNAVVINPRNAITSFKERYLMVAKGNNPHFVTIFGGMHVGIEDDIRKDDRELLGYLHLSKGLWKDKYDSRSIYTIYEFEFNGPEWHLKQVHEVPQLKQLAV